MRKLRIISAMFLLMGLCSLSVSAAGVNVASHSQEDIAEYYYENIAGLETKKDTMAETPVVTSPYSAGSLSDESLADALAVLNYMRYIAGISYDVVLNDHYNELTQAASLVNYVNGSLSHYPSQPSDMSDELYALGYTGASSSNIGYASYIRNLYTNIVHGWMADDSTSNMTTVGHRRWILNPTMGATGFGSVQISKSYSAMYAFDRTGSGTETGVIWPAQNMPVDLFKDSYPWSYSEGSSVGSNVTVTLTDLNDGTTWLMSTSGSSDGYITVNNAGYGQSGCIIFSPDDISYEAGDKFQVEITGSISVTYTVNFFDVTDLNADNTVPNVTTDTTTETTTETTDTTDTTDTSDDEEETTNEGDDTETVVEEEDEEDDDLSYLEGASDWAVSEIKEAYNMGLMDGLEDLLCDYTDNITREEFCRLVVNCYLAMGGEAVVGDSPFTDTDDDDVAIAYTLGIVNGMKATTFAPDEEITREQIATMLFRALELFGETEEGYFTGIYTDIIDISDYALEAMKYMNKNYIIVGYSSSRLAPQETVTRQQAILMAVRMVTMDE